ncbi:SpoIIIAH-like family protein [Aquibacillus koreensis]|uniref:SpoIIIAH-like family protein n=1 Tax=Aquibacillus koreensis TaxID=279446 RepID=A0A9X3WFR0_9BACI|nr:SpoIIIAH-like family protein [Aquibacillus koreensis]MCT2537521.1 SpoIIIAH-like family protein [Aquibacillus koreensis]MDC3418967.1 SpoIIIAH-like family protein [Aquibacillus koreensis]
MLKKQTVWLLTMLSLMIVLSVYYMSSPSGEDLAYLNSNGLEDETATTGAGEESTDLDASGEEVDQTMVGETEEQAMEEGEVTSSTSSDELFATIRMQLTNERSMEMERWEDVVASSSATTDEKEEAYERLQEIKSVSTKEMILEETLKSEKGYTDVLVRSTDQDIVVTVKADELSKTEANNIMQMARDEFGMMEVQVKYQPSSS